MSTITVNNIQDTRNFSRETSTTFTSSNETDKPNKRLRRYADVLDADFARALRLALSSSFVTVEQTKKFKKNFE